LLRAKQEVIVESPFVALSRLQSLRPVFELLIKRGVAVFVITKPPNEQTESLSEQSEAGIRYFETLGVQVLLCHNHHRKIAMIDREIVWKGSLNILSQKSSREFMERENDKEKCEVLFKFLKYNLIDGIKKHLLY
jgi:phosphatidylserine/phosphatidylglycerophosphate/cardiolipin synthase-like enzyme